MRGPLGVQGEYTDLMATAHRDIALPEGVIEYDRWLREGKRELGWRGDPRLWLEIGLIETHQYGFCEKTKQFQRPGDVIGWQWQVWRHTELGKDEIILTLKGHELPFMFDKLVSMDPRTPGFQPVMERVESEDAVVQKHKQDAIAEARGEQMDHLWRLVEERRNGRHTTYQVPGSDPERQM